MFGGAIHSPVISGPRFPALKIEPGDIHLWRATLADESGELSLAGNTVLSREERDRADSFRFETDRRRFVVARVLLRRLLSGCTGVAPEAIAIVTDRFGKPRINHPLKPIHFNLSHSGDSALFAVSADDPIGVDLEECLRADRLPDCAASYCSPRELKFVGHLPAGDRPRALLRLWTAKEAFLKAVGTGFQIAPDRVEVPESIIRGDARPGAVTWTDSPDISARWVLHPLPGFESRFGASAIVAVTRRPMTCRLVWHGSLGA